MKDNFIPYMIATIAICILVIVYMFINMSYKRDKHRSIEQRLHIAIDEKNTKIDKQTQIISSMASRASLAKTELAKATTKLNH